MKLIHLSDLHIGKRVNEFSMIEDQEYILKSILNVIDEEDPDGVMIAGDVYDKSVPSAEAVELFDEFLVKLSEKRADIFIISGNHDSPERLSFASRIMEREGIHISPVYDGTVEPVVLEDAYGEVAFYLLPFVKPVVVKRFFPDDAIDSYTDAVRSAIGGMEIVPDRRNVIITHQFVTGAERSDSEDITVGGSDNVDAGVFEPFDYVALGHIHGPQDIVKGKIRYCGTPLKYSFSEAKHQKSVTAVELRGKGDVEVRTVPLKPYRDMAEISGTYDTLVSKSFYEGTTYQSDYLHITLTDEEDIPDAVIRLRTIYRNLMKLDYDNKRTRNTAAVTGDCEARKKSPLTLLNEFYEKQNGAPLSVEQESFASELISGIWEDEQ